MYNSAQSRNDHDAAVIRTAVNYRAHRFRNGGVDRLESADLREVLRHAVLALRTGTRVLVYAVNADGLEALIPEGQWLYWLKEKTNGN